MRGEPIAADGVVDIANDNVYVSGLRVERLARPGVRVIELTVPAGSCTAVFGPSGSGKTLLLRAIADLDEADGEVWLDDRARSSLSGPAWRRQVIYVAAESHWWAPQVGPHAPHWPRADLEALGFDASKETVVSGRLAGYRIIHFGTHGIVERLRPYATSSRRGQLATWAMGLLVFFDDYANTLIVGNTMRPLTDRLRVSREKLSFLVDSTAAPVASIAPIASK